MRFALSVLVSCLATLSSIPFALALSSSEAGKHDWTIERIGVPRVNSLPNHPPVLQSSVFSPYYTPLSPASSQSSAHASGSVSVGNSRPRSYSSAAQYLTPRFHRILNPKTFKPGDKTQTAIYTATESNVLAALNPRNGAIVWRHVYEDDDEIQAFYTAADVVLALSGPGGSTARLYQAFTGYMIWSYEAHTPSQGLLPEPGFPGVDASFVTAGEAGGDVIVLTNADTIARVDGMNGRRIWKWSLKEDGGDDVSSRIFIRTIATGSKVFAVALKKNSGILSGSTYSISIYSFAHNGTLLGTRDIASSSVPGGAVDVVLISPGGKPQLAWKGKDGFVKSTPVDSTDTKGATLQSASPNDFDGKYVRLAELGNAAVDKGFFATQREDGKGEVFRISPDGKLKMVQESEEKAHDAVWSSCLDRQGSLYVNRIFFGRAQNLLNFHTFWADTNEGQGQVTGFSFQYDHDLNGAVLAAPFEVSPVSQYQLVTRAAFVTSSGSLRMIQEDKHFWMREEGLSQVTHSLIVDLPEKALGNNEILAAMQGEGFVNRLLRHAAAVKDLPEYFINFGKRVALPQEEPTFSGTAGAPAPRETPSTTQSQRTVSGQMPSGAVRAPASKDTQPAASPNEHVPSLAPRIAESNVTAELYRDTFGFRKVIVQVTRHGKIYATDAGNKGRFIWEKSLVGYGQGEGDPEPKVKVHGLFQTRESLGAARTPLVTLIADVQVDENAPVITRAFDFDPITGTFEKDAQEGLPISVGGAKDVFLLPSSTDNDPRARKLVGLVDKNNKLVIYPLATRSLVLSALQSKFFYALPTLSAGAQAALQGYTVASDGSSTPTWKVRLAPGELINDVISPSSAAIASQGKVLGDRSTLYKYLNPHGHVVVTSNPSTHSAGIYLVDYVSGKVLHETQIQHVDAASGVHVVFVENWIVVSYSSSLPEEGLVTRLVSIELYEDSNRDQTWEWTGNFTSFGRSASASGGGSGSSVRAYQQTYNFPRQIRALGTTATKFGISIKNLLIATDEGYVFSIPRRMLDPRRPVGRKPTQQESEEWLIPYDPTVPDQMKWTLSHVNMVKKAEQIITAPALLESTSLVLVNGLDTFFTRVTPSNTFDLLSSSFNKIQLLLTIAGLSAGIILTKGPVRNKALKLRW